MTKKKARSREESFDTSSLPRFTKDQKVDIFWLSRVPQVTLVGARPVMIANSRSGRIEAIYHQEA
jgi:hypothetical protein